MPETTQFPGMDGDNSYQSLPPNAVLLNRYRILSSIGGGGQGAVYQARDLNFPDVHKLVAIKEMLNPTADPNHRASTMKTFRREANILATLSHPAIPQIFDNFDRNNRAYLVMEFINGNDLEALLAKTKELPVNKIIEWAIDLCDVLDYLHNYKPEPIIFRDMKPSNVMVDSIGKVRLIDFGIAKTFTPNIKHTMIGTEGYSAPEQYKGNVSPLSDIYSLGATLHHVLTRRDPRLEPPFSFAERPIQDSNPNVPTEFVRIIEKMVEFDPVNRFQSCVELKSELQRLLYRPVNVGTSSTPSSETDFFGNMKATGQPEPKWKYTIEDEIRGSCSGLGDRIFVGSYDTNVWSFTRDTGDLLWKYYTNGGIASTPCPDEDTRLVFVGSEDHSFHAIDINTGRINWSYATKGRIRSSPTVAHGRVFFGSDDGHIYALMAANGRYLWSYDLGAPVRSKPFVTDTLVIAGAESGDIIALELAGTRKWSSRARRNVTSSPFVDPVEEICYVGSSDHHMYALDANSGYSSWRVRTGGPIISSPIVADNLLYFGSTDGYVYALNAQTSKERWKFNAEKPVVASPVYHEGNIYIGVTDGNFYCLNGTTGKEIWRFKAGGPITGGAYIAGDTIVFGSLDKTLYALPLVG